MPVISLPDAEWSERVGALAGVEVVHWDMTCPAPRADELELVVPPYLGAREHLRDLRDLPRLRLVQLLTAGYDDALPHIGPGVQLANAAGVHDASTAELAVSLTLAAERGLPEFVAAQERSEWLPTTIRGSLADKKVLVLGYGSIGHAVARRMAPFEVSLTAVASRARAGDELVPSVHGVDELPDLLPQQDVVVVIVPLTEATTSLVGDAFLAAMKPGALLVNVARGRVVDTDALVAALHAGRVRAALDVTDPEPLPGDHPLWQAPGVLISPHVGGATDAFAPRAARLLREQLSAYVGGRPPLNVVHTG